ncbi:type II toxin-antitoxin system VapC family toxin [Methylobrevis albus]|uniref:Ribonuclease VapC n=1 Tax=Methylobrevis albus TaxID=2793297 RepID=A0A931N118_9HYPH|nr:type II toxin-antitoxin system VapC family toxin [Methylobrevis albus]MBH0239366.1 type II toxin-antitoxin system VapC family toxin [Methylobrevis albus]
MIICDTNVLSELMRGAPAPAVLDWISRQDTAVLFTTAMTQAEVLYGLAILPEGRRRVDLMAAARKTFEIEFSGRVLPFDTAAAEHFADIVSTRRATGLPISQIDAQIAAVARSQSAVLATRNVRDFVGCGIDIVDPWRAD